MPALHPHQTRLDCDNLNTYVNKTTTFCGRPTAYHYRLWSARSGWARAIASALRYSMLGEGLCSTL